MYVNDFIMKCFDECNIKLCILKCPTKTYLNDIDKKYKITKVPIKAFHNFTAKKLKVTNLDLFMLVIISKFY